jgi:CheY-like chemotaxis protein
MSRSSSYRRIRVVVQSTGRAKAVSVGKKVKTVPVVTDETKWWLALTAFVRSEDRQRVLRSGYQMHVAKPVEPSELLTVCASLVGRIG